MWNGTNWVSDRNAIANAINEIVLKDDLSEYNNQSINPFVRQNDLVNLVDEQDLVSILNANKHTDLELSCTTSGQTIFSIFSLPTKSNLIINGSEYFENIHYSIGMINLNATLTWLNIEFQIAINDKIIFRKY